jgi:PKD repeat protein
LTNEFEIISSGVTDTILITAYDTVTVFNTTGGINFTATPVRGCLSDFQQFVVHFTNITPGDIDSVEWRFGDGYISHDLEPYHAYITPEHYSCTLKVWGPCGSGETHINDMIWVDDSIPTGLATEEYFTITPLTADTGDTFFLDGQLTDSMLSYTWTIEWTDGTDSVIASAPGELGIDTLSFIFDGAGTFDISLQISNECNAFTVKDSVVVTFPPEPPTK